MQQVLQDIKASNQMAAFLGNKVEMAITKAVEANKSVLKVGLHFEFGDCRYVFLLSGDGRRRVPKTPFFLPSIFDVFFFQSDADNPCSICILETSVFRV